VAKLTEGTASIISPASARLPASTKLCPPKAVALLGTRVAETILASGHVRPHTKAAYMEASDPIKNICKKHLQVGAVHIWKWKRLREA
jgi:hypothetical protein